jgi:hypothetical protein
VNASAAPTAATPTGTTQEGQIASSSISIPTPSIPAVGSAPVTQTASSQTSATQTGSPQTNSTQSGPAPATRTQLPRTASQLPLIAMVGTAAARGANSGLLLTGRTRSRARHCEGSPGSLCDGSAQGGLPDY